MSENTKREDAYVVIPQKEYSQLYNGQYAKLTTLQKSLDPRGENSSYLEATLKKHYPKVYKDMIQNDYILTGSQCIQDVLNEESNNEERQRKNMQMSKQLDEVVSGKQKTETVIQPTQTDSTTIRRQTHTVITIRTATGLQVVLKHVR